MSIVSLSIPALTVLINNTFESQDEITLLSVCTTDGFNLYGRSSEDNFIEQDKISAIASSLGSLANSSSKLITGHESIITTIESNGGHVIFQRTLFCAQPAVVSLATNPKLPLAHVRFCLKKVIESIRSIR